MKSYRELIQNRTFEERFRYLQLRGAVGAETFGFDRYLNQVFYKNPEWKRVRRLVILRDEGFDLASKDRPIPGMIIVHHINPITKDDILDRAPLLFDPENLICCSKATHNAIHYGDESLLSSQFVERQPNDTCPWKSMGKGE